MAKIRYRITQDRWCWCGAPAALRVVAARDEIKPIPVCSIDHGQTEIERLRADVLPEGSLRSRNEISDES